jgi:hypothetical protein
VEELEYDLFELLSETLQQDARAFSPQKGMYQWDHEVLVYLCSQGYESKGFSTLDGDSFGPLVRGLYLRKRGELKWKLYAYS